MTTYRRISVWFCTTGLLLFSILVLITSEPVHAQGPLKRTPGTSEIGATTITPGPTASAEDLALAMGIPPANLVNASFNSSDSRGAGIENEPLGDFFPTSGDTFAILATGLAIKADTPDTNNDEGFQDFNDIGDLSSPFDPANPLEGLDGLNNAAGFDLVQLTMVLSPPVGSTGLNFDFAFYSEEFPDWIDTEYNDAFIAELGIEPFSSGLTISGIDIDSPHNFAFDSNGDVISVNAAFGFDISNLNPNTGSTYDGTSGLLTATGCLPDDLPPDNNIVVILSITDMGDNHLDSAVFLDNFQWGDRADCTPGASEEEPTAIDLASFTIEANEGQAVVIWKTATEVDNAGFNIYRAVDPEGPWQKVNSALIAAQGDPVSGAAYTYVDMPGRGTFYYRLEDIDFFGVSTLHEPTLAELGSPIRIPWYRPLLPKFE